jgi:hypothetical protein
VQEKDYLADILNTEASKLFRGKFADVHDRDISFVTWKDLNYCLDSPSICSSQETGLLDCYVMFLLRFYSGKLDWK